MTQSAISNAQNFDKTKDHQRHNKIEDKEHGYLRINKLTSAIFTHVGKAMKDFCPLFSNVPMIENWSWIHFICDKPNMFLNWYVYAF